MKIKELTFDETQDVGIQAVSLVDDPAIKLNWQYFSQENFLKTKGISNPNTDRQPLAHKGKVKETDTTILLDPDYGTWRFWKVETVNNEPWQIDTSHEFCKNHAKPGSNVYTIDEIRSWSSKLTSGDDGTKNGWIEQSTYCDNFNGNPEAGYNLNNQLYNCRHFLSAVRDINDVPPKYRKSKITYSSENFKVDLGVSNVEQRIIKGPVMVPDTLILRKDKITNEIYSIYFKCETIKKLKDKYGFNREITIYHEDNVTGNAILLNSWIFDGTNDNCGINDLKIGSWCMEYKILSETLWNYVKTEKVKGFSVELVLQTSNT